MNNNKDALSVQCSSPHSRMSASVLLFCIVFFTDAACTAAYRVVVTSSPQSPIPFTTTSVQLHCSVTPLPPAPVEYRWTVVPNYFSTSNPSSSNYKLPTVTTSISSYWPWSIRHPTYYCHVYSNGTQVATGRLALTVQGLLQYVSAPVLQFTHGDNVILQFNVSDHDSYIASSIKKYHWFHKGWCIDCYSYDHYQFDLNNTRLTIRNASEDDIGQYEVRVTELNRYASDPLKCDSITFGVLKHQAVLAPVVIHLSLTENNNTDKFTEVKVLHYYGDLNQALTVSVEYEKPDEFRSLNFIMYSDGKQLANHLASSGGPFYGTNESHLMIHVPQYNESWAGDYTFVSYADCHNVVWSTLLSGCDYSHDFVCHDIHLILILESVLQVSVGTLETPLVEIQSDHTIVWNMYRGTGSAIAILNCSAEGGNPEKYTVQLMKEGEQLMSTTSGPAVLLYSPSHYQQQFGLFTCSVVNEYFNINKSVLIQERVSIQGLWLFCVPGVILHSTLEMQTSIKNVIVNTMNFISSSWSITNESLHNCSTDTTIVGVYYTCDLVYSSPSGTITASSIISRTQEWLLQQEDNIVVRTNEATLELSKLCLLQRDDSSMATCSRVREKLAETIPLSTPASTRESPSASGLPTITAHTSNNVGVVTGAFIGGFLGGLLTCLSGIAIYFMINYILSKRKTDTTTSTEYIELQNNTAYDTVKYEQPPQQHVQPPPRHAQPPPQHVQSLPRHVKPPPRRAQPPPQDSRDHSTYENVVTNYKISSFMHSGTTQST